jgi:hypothetical protein
MTAERQGPANIRSTDPTSPPSDSYSEARAQRIRQVQRRLTAGVYETGAVRDELAWRLARVLRDVPLEDL